MDRKHESLVQLKTAAQYLDLCQFCGGSLHHGSRLYTVQPGPRLDLVHPFVD